MTDQIDAAARATLDSFQAKYEDERQKRLRADGVKQYKAFDSEVKH